MLEIEFCRLFSAPIIGGLLAAAVLLGSAASAAEPSAEGRSFEEQKAKFESEKSKEPQDRIQTVLEFGDIDSPDTVPFLAELLKTGDDVPVYAAAVRALGKRGTLEAVQAVVLQGIPLLEKSAFQLPAVGEALANPLEKKAEEWLLRHGFTDNVRQNPAVFEIMVKAVAGLQAKGRFRVLNRILYTSRDAASQVTILDTLRTYRPQSAGKDAYGLIMSSQPTVQVAALEVLLAVGAKRSSYTRRYVSLLKSPHPDVRALAVDLLAMAEYRRLFQVLLPLLDDPDDRVKIAVIAAFLNSGDERVVEALIQAMDKHEGRVKDDIVDALIRLTGANVGESSIQWESWWSAHKRDTKIRKRTQEEFGGVKRREAFNEKVTGLYHGIRVRSENCVFIIDTSQSMAEVYKVVTERQTGQAGKTEVESENDAEDDDGKMEEKIVVAQRELLKVLDWLATGIVMNIVRIDTFPSSWKPSPVELSEGTRKEARHFVKELKPEGMTNVYGAIRMAFGDERIDTIYLLTDGAPTTGKYIETPKILAAVAEMNRRRRVKINTIGFNLSPQEEVLLRELADANSGVFIAR